MYLVEVPLLIMAKHTFARFFPALMLSRFAFSSVMLPDSFKNRAEALELVACKVRMGWQRHVIGGKVTVPEFLRSDNIRTNNPLA